MPTVVLKKLKAIKDFFLLIGFAIALCVIEILEGTTRKIPSRRVKLFVGHVWAGFGGRRCYCCNVPRVYAASWHTTPGAAHPQRAPKEAHVFGSGRYSYDADSPLCQDCWVELATPQDRLPLHFLWIEDGREAIRGYLSSPVWRTSPVEDWEVDMAVAQLLEWVEEIVTGEKPKPRRHLAVVGSDRFWRPQQATSGDITNH